jgi:hypothetical protein
LKTVLVDYNPVAQLLTKAVSKVGLLGDFADYLRSLLFTKDDANLEKLLFLLGISAMTLHAGCVLTKSIKKWKWVPKHLAASSKLTSENLKQRYGNCFVLITGFKQGIGRGYA